jgi:hypothetical protein
MKFELKPYNHNVPDEELLSDMKKVAQELNKQALSINDYNNSKVNRFHSDTISTRFNGWHNALSLAGLERKSLKIPIISDDDILEDLKRVAGEIAPQRISIGRYNEKGKFSSTIIKRRFGWNAALQNAGIDAYITNQRINKSDLLENLQEVWIKLGRQPSIADMVKPHSKYTIGPYGKTFGSWRKALEAFIEYINSYEATNQEIYETQEKNDSIESEYFVLQQNEKVEEIKKEITYNHKTPRNPSVRLQMKVLIRDGNKCRLCGITIVGRENMHFDHDIPWIKNGETTFENMQILCRNCNLAKGDLDKLILEVISKILLT